MLVFLFAVYVVAYMVIGLLNLIVKAACCDC